MTMEQALAAMELVLREIGLTRNDIKNDEERAIIKLMLHPKHARRLQRIAEEAIKSDLAA